jgi:hypothetical protein
MPNTKPLVAVATLCEQILEEKDGVVSVIRVVDTYHVEPPKDLPAGKVAVIASRPPVCTAGRRAWRRWQA